MGNTFKAVGDLWAAPYKAAGDALFPDAPKANIPTNSPIDNFINTRDEISGTESVKVQQPDGSWTIVTRQLPLTADQQAEKDQLDKIARENLARYEDLATNFDTSQIPGLQEYIDAFTTTSKRVLGESYKTASEASERSLARGGLDDSTAAVQERSRNKKSYVQGLEQIGRDAEQTKQDVRNQEKQNALSLYSLATGRQDALLNTMAAGAANNTQTSLSLSALGTKNDWNVYNANLDAAKAEAKAQQAGLQNLLSLGRLAASAYTGGFA